MTLGQPVCIYPSSELSCVVAEIGPFISLEHFYLFC